MRGRPRCLAGASGSSPASTARLSARLTSSGAIRLSSSARRSWSFSNLVAAHRLADRHVHGVAFRRNRLHQQPAAGRQRGQDAPEVALIGGLAHIAAKLQLAHDARQRRHQQRCPARQFRKLDGGDFFHRLQNPPLRLGQIVAPQQIAEMRHDAFARAHQRQRQPLAGVVPSPAVHFGEAGLSGIAHASVALKRLSRCWSRLAVVRYIRNHLCHKSLLAPIAPRGNA